MEQVLAARPQVEPFHYQGLKYDTRERFASYWHQLDLVLRHEPRRVLEVGPGSAIVSDYLRARGVDLVTLDLDPALAPTVAGAADALPFASGSFDLILCCQVLEHMPFETARRAVSEFRRVAQSKVVLSLPDVTPCMRVLLPVPGRPEVEQLVPRWWRRAPVRVTNPREHHWEIGVRGYPLGRVRAMLEGEGLSVRRHFRVFQNPFHHFFELTPRW